MPELPEVETMRRCVLPVVGSRICGLSRPRSRLQPIKIAPRLSDFRRRVTGRDIEAVGRVGKRVVVELDGEGSQQGDRIVFEPRMSGLVLLADPPTEEHVRLVFALSGREPSELLFWNRRGLGVVRLMSPRLFARELGPDRLGPDALDVSLETLIERFNSSRRAIKVALLDQRSLAGVGNLYASEILHRAGVHPEAACNVLTRAKWQAIHAAMSEVLHEAIEHQGSTLRDGTYRIARNQPGNFQVCHRVYQRGGEACLQCGRSEIVRIVQAQRSTFFCPRCQRRPQK